MMDWWYGWGGVGMFYFPILWIVLIAIIVGLFMRGTNKNNTIPNKSTKSALDILKKRYAKGEIDEEQFEKIKKDISN